MCELTERQAAVLELVRAFIEERGYSPTVREIAAEYGCSAAGMHQHLQSLRSHGYLEWSPNTARTMRLLD